MGDVIRILKDTPIPTTLIWAGLFFLLLAFITKLGGIIEVQPNQKLPAILIGLLLLAIGLVLNLSPASFTSSQSTAPAPTSSPATASPVTEPTPSPTSTQPIQPSQQNACSTLLQTGAVLNWKIRNYGKLGNIGTLEIKAANSATGEWAGDQITETKDDLRLGVTGTFNGSTMSLIHPTAPEKWLGSCHKGKIEGSIETTYPSQLTFEMNQ